MEHYKLYSRVGVPVGVEVAVTNDGCQATDTPAHLIPHHTLQYTEGNKLDP